MRGLHLAVLVASLAVAGCQNVARLSDLPTSSENVRFGPSGDTHRGHYECDFSLRDVSDEQFESATRQGLTTNDFSIVRDDPAARTILAKRGLRPNEYASVVGVYWRRVDAGLEAKVLVRITQDALGTFKQSYAENLANRIRKFLSRDLARPLESL